MSRQAVRTGVDLASAGVADEFEGEFLLLESEQRVSRLGEPYWRVKLADRAGAALGGHRFRCAEAPPAPGTVVRLAGTLEQYHGERTLRIRACTPAPAGIAAAEEWLPHVDVTPETLRRRLDDAIGALGAAPLRALLAAVFADEGTQARYLSAPAASHYHSARLGGLALHSLAVRAIALSVAAAFESLRCDRDLLAAGALVHDLGKIDELELTLAGGGKPAYTLGRLQGHIVHGVRRVERAAAAAGLDGAVLEHLIHLIVSHHGSPEAGSPAAPMTLEAQVLHVADYAASRVEGALDAIAACAPGTLWAPYHHMLGTCLYAGFGAGHR